MSEEIIRNVCKKVLQECGFNILKLTSMYGDGILLKDNFLYQYGIDDSILRLKFFRGANTEPNIYSIDIINPECNDTIKKLTPIHILQEHPIVEVIGYNVHYSLYTLYKDRFDSIKHYITNDDYVYLDKSKLRVSDLELCRISQFVVPDEHELQEINSGDLIYETY